MLTGENLREADRLMTVCNACRYCEDLCAVFPAMEMRRTFAEGDLNLLANLCHACGACYDDCQFAPPHEFEVNVPQVLARLRRDSWEVYARPAVLAPLFRKNGIVVAVTAALSVALFMIGFAAWHEPSVLFAEHVGPGAFYRLMPHNGMVMLFGGVFLFACASMALSLRAFWRDINSRNPLRLDATSLWQAVRDAGSLRYLDGGGDGCRDESEEPRDYRRLFHHFTSYGFLLCFASTSVATIFHYVLGREAPYAWYELPVVLGTLGGIGLVIGPLGLLRARRRRRPELVDASQTGMDTAFTLMLLLTAVSGLALLLLRDTAAMASLLALHLGVVFALFLTMPYGRFMHGLYRFVALVRYACERQERSRIINTDNQH